VVFEGFVVGQDDSGGDDRAKERAAANFVDASDYAGAFGAGVALELPGADPFGEDLLVCCFAGLALGFGFFFPGCFWRDGWLGFALALFWIDDQLRARGHGNKYRNRRWPVTKDIVEILSGIFR
jgi:hypothetical protein